VVTLQNSSLETICNTRISKSAAKNECRWSPASRSTTHTQRHAASSTGAFSFIFTISLKGLLDLRRCAISSLCKGQNYVFLPCNFHILPKICLFNTLKKLPILLLVMFAFKINSFLENKNIMSAGKFILLTLWILGFV